MDRTLIGSLVAAAGIVMALGTYTCTVVSDDLRDVRADLMDAIGTARDNTNRQFADVDRQFEDVDGDITLLRDETISRINDVDGDITLLREDMNRQFDRLYNAIVASNSTPPVLPRTDSETTHPRR